MARQAPTQAPPSASLPPAPAHGLVRDLLAWYGRTHRQLPWRAAYGELAEPYHVWLSEIMLQQTTVPAAIPYYVKFLAHFPSIGSLAAAADEEVMALWAGLGYYSRARNLLACARVLAAPPYNGTFPSTHDELLALPGIGPYTAGAILSFAFGQRALVVDGNIERVVSRLYSLETPLPALKKQVALYVQPLFESPENTAPSSLPQAFMDLAASICLPARPRCEQCPISAYCSGYESGVAATLPRRLPKQKKPQRTAWAYIIENGEGHVALVRRPPQGLLGGMMALPSSELGLGPADTLPDHPSSFEVVGDTGLRVRHVFTHFELTLHLATARFARHKAGLTALSEVIWVSPETLDAKMAGLPSLFMKAWRAWASRPSR